jgi:hypothetical protein
MAKVAFSRSDVMAINDRMVGKSSVPSEAKYAPAPTSLSRAPSSPVAAKVMREVGVSIEKMSEAYRLARKTVNSK